MSVADYLALPPEVNSARMYSGAGAGPLVTAATTWDGVAAELSSAGRSYQAVVSQLTSGPWLGPSSAALAAAAAPYVAWINTTAAQAEQTANQARSAVSAYETAFAATVPPQLIAANRASLSYLVVTNTVGQNTPAIAANEAQYSDFWAQDVAAMSAYASSSAAATTLTPFSPAQQNTNPAGTSAQAAAVSQVAGTPAANAANTVSQVSSNSVQSLTSALSNPIQWLENLLGSPTALALNNFVLNMGDDLSAMSGPWFLACVFPELLSPLFVLALPATAAASTASSVSPLPGGAVGGTLVGSSGSGAFGSAAGAEVSAGLGEAGSVGGMSVPQTWAAAAPEIRLAATALSTAGLNGLPEVAAAGSGGWFNGVPVMGNMINASRGGGTDSPAGSNRTKTRQKAGQPGAPEDTPGWTVSPDRHVPEGLGVMSERDELNELRKTKAALTKERDVLKRSASLLINEATQR